MYLQYTIDDGGVFDCGVRSGKRRKMLAISFSFDPVANFRGKKAINFHVAFSLRTLKVNYCVFYISFQKHISLYVNLSHRIAFKMKKNLIYICKHFALRAISLKR